MRTSTLDSKTAVDKGQEAAAPGEDHPLAPGTSAGRYVVLERLGVGGMGYVYSAYDPDLDRRVALKILRPDRHQSEAETRKAQARLLREARVLARLQHPNVVAIYDVGTLEGQVFIAMAFVEGENLEQWMRRKERSFKQVLKRFIAAGRGLAAAHAAGLVHRDFKPANVMLGNDGQVRVVDFGLARRCTTPPEGALEPRLDFEASPTPNTDLLQTITKTGAVLGTPAYMAPEQHQREIPDARTDQFAYCVALYEALYGERPFEGSNLRETQLRVLVGELRETPYNSTVPLWLRTALLRGLETSPEERYPSMDALLDALENHPDRAQRQKNHLARTLGMAGIGLLFGFGTAFLVSKAIAPQERDPVVVIPEPVGISEEELQARIAETVAKQTSATEDAIREEYEEQLEELRRQLEVVRRQSEERLQMAQDFRTQGTQPPENAPPRTGSGSADTESEPMEDNASAQPEFIAPPEGPPLSSPQLASTPPVPTLPSSSPTPAEIAPPPPAAPPPPRVEPGDLVVLGPGVVPPRAVRPLQPAFPQMAKRFQRKEAKVRLRLLIDEHGKVLKAELMGPRQGYGFDEEALSAARRSSYKPATKRGVPVKVWKTLLVEFRER